MNKFIQIALLLWLAALSLANTPIAASRGLQLTPCLLPGTGEKANCGTLEVPENPGDPSGKTIFIQVAVLPALSGNPLPDPLFMFAGGPGQSAIESFPPLASRLGKLRQQRDIVLIDQRGTGDSNPLHCPASAELLSKQDWHPEEIEQYITDCLKQLPGDPRYYTTAIAIEDFQKVREALGYSQINLLGVSYGTRVAQAYMRRFPETVRTVVLDGVVPTDLILGTEHASKLQQTLQAIIARCRQEDSCNNHFPNLEQSLATLIERVEATPALLNIPSPRTGKITEINVDKNTLALAIRMLSYAPETQALLPLLIHEAAQQENLSRLAGQALLVQESLHQSISKGLELSVICSEDARFYPAIALNGDTLLGNTMTESTKDACKIWPRGDIAGDFHQPFTSDIPVLLLSGEYDPVTPPEYGERALQQFSNGLHLTAPGQGHSVSVRGCIPKIISQFIASGSTQGLDVECLENLSPSPFFTTLMGPEP